MPRKMRVAKGRRTTQVPSLFKYWLRFGRLPPKEEEHLYDGDSLDVFFLRFCPEATLAHVPWRSPGLPRSPAAIWDLARDEVIEQCIEETPGARPYGWWRY